MSNQKYEKLMQLLEGYFHQDWKHLYASPDDAIQAFRKEANADQLREVSAELNEAISVVRTMDNNDALVFLWKQLGCYYYPKADGTTVAEWLEHVRDQLGCGKKKGAG
jgi:hypothetical protein